MCVNNVRKTKEEKIYLAGGGGGLHIYLALVVVDEVVCELEKGFKERDNIVHIKGSRKAKAKATTPASLVCVQTTIMMCKPTSFSRIFPGRIIIKGEVGPLR